MVRILLSPDIKERFLFDHQAVQCPVVNDVIDGERVFRVIGTRMLNPVQRLFQVDIPSAPAARFQPQPHFVAQLVELAVEIAGDDEVLAQAGAGIDPAG